MFSAAVARQTPLTALVFADGIEPVHSPATARLERDLARETASRLGLPLLEVETDARAFTDPFYGWGNVHGSVLAGLGTALNGSLGTAIIPSTDSFASVVPYGTNPLVDHLWSTAAVEVRHDDLSLTRTGKVAALAEQRPDLLPYLKVCFEQDRVDNCGQCGKCLLTMASLIAVGKLSLATGFPNQIDLDRVRGMGVHPIQSRIHIVACMRALGGHGYRGEVRDAMAVALRRSARPRLAKRVRLWTERAVGRRRSADPSWRDPDQGFHWRFNAELLSLFTRGRPDRPLSDEVEPPHVTARLRPPP
jgi:hypothetical protein